MILQMEKELVDLDLQINKKNKNFETLEMSEENNKYVYP